MQLRLLKGEEAALKRGMPWVMKHQVNYTSEVELAEPGTQVDIVGFRGDFIGMGYLNPESYITARLLSPRKVAIDEAWFAEKISAALKKREGWLDAPYYRLVHSESDGLPGLIIERYGDIVVVQCGTAGMEKLKTYWLAAIEKILKPKALLLKNESEARQAEGLEKQAELRYGEIPDIVEVMEHGTIFLADLLKGQKTGWFYDMRANRQWIAKQAKDKTVFDIYSHSGGFGIPAAKAGAARVVMMDRSGLALGLARQAAVQNGVSEKCETRQGEAFALMEAAAKAGEKADIVIADPPPFIKARRDIAAGMKGYQKVARWASALVAPGGLLFVASCSHHAERKAFLKAVEAGMAQSGREGKLIKEMGADRDHPVHPQLPQSEYLKAGVWRLAE